MRYYLHHYADERASTYEKYCILMSPVAAKYEQLVDIKQETVVIKQETEEKKEHTKRINKQTRISL